MPSHGQVSKTPERLSRTERTWELVARPLLDSVTSAKPQTLKDTQELLWPEAVLTAVSSYQEAGATRALRPGHSMVSRKPSSHCRLSGCWESPAVKFKRKPPSLLHWLQGQRPQKKKPLPPRPLLEPSDSLWDICGLPGCGLRENKGHALNRYSYPAVHIHQGPAASFFWAPPAQDPLYL